MIDLYHVRTVIPRFKGHRDVDFTWFEEYGESPVPYAQAIRNYGQCPVDLRPYCDSAVDELLTHEEAAALKAYLEENHPDCAHTLEKVELPLTANTMGLIAVPLGGGPCRASPAIKTARFSQPRGRSNGCRARAAKTGTTWLALSPRRPPCQSLQRDGPLARLALDGAPMASAMRAC